MMPARAPLLLFAALAAAFLVACERRAQLGATPGQEPGALDVIIVGGGLAGLTAAHELRDRRVLLIEKESRLGGRVKTKERDDLTYEMGALFEYEPRWLPSGEKPSESLPGSTRVGLARGRSMIFGNTVEDVAAQVLAASPLEGGAAGAGSHAVALSTVPEPVRSAFFGVIHPGEMAEYLPARQLDWSVTHRTRRRKGGNGELVAALAAASGARIELGATATSVRETAQGVEVTYTRDGRTRTATARAAVVATNARVAATLLGELANDSPIRRVRYAPGIVVALGVRSTAMEDFAYVASAGGPLSAVFSHRQGDRRVLTVYYARTQAEAVADLGDAALVARTAEYVSSLGAGPLAAADVLFSDVERWPALGTVIAEDPYATWSESWSRPAERVFLAGDYTQFGEAQMPFGMAAATASGRAAGQRAASYLRGALEPLARAPRADRGAPGTPSAAPDAVPRPSAPTPFPGPPPRRRGHHPWHSPRPRLRRARARTCIGRCVCRCPLRQIRGPSPAAMSSRSGVARPGSWAPSPKAT